MSEIRTKYKFIQFKVIAEKPKTKVWACLNNRWLDALGVVSWYGPWRQYCFTPAAGTVFNKSCLADIQNFIEQL